MKGSISSLTKSKTAVKIYPKKSGEKLVKKFKIHYIRYADDFIIITISKHLVNKYIKPAVVNFLATRGLKLSSEKTKCFSLTEQNLDFLGYTFMYKEK